MFLHPFNTIVAGPSGCGKTYFVRKLLHDNLITPRLTKPKVLWAYGQWQSLYNIPIRGVVIQYFDGLPSKDELLKIKPNVCVIDDLMTEVANNKEMTNIFTKFSHHLGIDIIFLAQNIFYKGSEMRTINLNAHYLVLFRNPRDETQIEYVGRQVTPRGWPRKFFDEIFDDATSQPYGYLLVDCKPETSKFQKFITRIFKSDGDTVYYMPQNVYQFEK